MAEMTPENFKRWRELAAALDFDAGTAQLIVPQLIDEVERLRALLERVRTYAIVDPMGNPDRIALPHAARMFGLERDVDDALEKPPTAERLAATIDWLRRR